MHADFARQHPDRNTLYKFNGEDSEEFAISMRKTGVPVGGSPPWDRCLSKLFEVNFPQPALRDDALSRFHALKRQ